MRKTLLKKGRAGWPFVFLLVTAAIAIAAMGLPNRRSNAIGNAFPNHLPAGGGVDALADGSGPPNAKPTRTLANPTAVDIAIAAIGKEPTTGATTDPNLMPLADVNGLSVSVTAPPDPDLSHSTKGD